MAIKTVFVPAGNENRLFLSLDLLSAHFDAKMDTHMNDVPVLYGNRK